MASWSWCTAREVRRCERPAITRVYVRMCPVFVPPLFVGADLGCEEHAATTVFSTRWWYLSLCAVGVGVVAVPAGRAVMACAKSAAVMFVVPRDEYLGHRSSLSDLAHVRDLADDARHLSSIPWLQSVPVDQVS